MKPLLITAFLLGMYAYSFAQNNSTFTIAEKFDLATITDSTRFMPVFDSIVPAQYDFTIFNMWGGVMFHTDIQEQGWNGRLNNRYDVCMEATYMWTLDYTVQGDTIKHLHTGFVTLINASPDVKIAGLDTLQCQPTLYVPNSFCPNCDGLNDVFIPVFGCPPLDYELYIFDRWGNPIFQTTDREKGWDGTTNGSIVPTDTYVYRIKCRFYAGDKLHQFTGHVNLIR